MKNTTQQLKEWAINKIKTEYIDDVALLIAVEGVSTNNDGHGECFDYFIPITNRGYELSQTFIIDGIGYDLYPRSWEKTENTASFDSQGTQCVGNAKILYSRTKEDEERFLGLKAKQNDYLQNKDFTYKKSLEQLDVAMDLYRTMMFEDSLYKVRMAAGYIIDCLSNVTAYLNGKYLISWSLIKGESEFILDNIPKNFIEYCDAIIGAKNSNELKNLSHLIISTTRRYLQDNKPNSLQSSSEVDFNNLADWYQELSLTWRRLNFYCTTNNKREAFIDANFIQRELMVIEDEFRLCEMDLMGYFDVDDLEKTKRRAIELEDYIVNEIESRDIKINKYNTVEDFLAKN